MLRIGAWTVDEKLCRLSQEGSEKTVQFRVMALLLFFAKNSNQVLSKDEIATQVWQGTSVSDDAIVNVVVKLRKALGDTSKNPSYIETIPKIGYRFIADVKIIVDPKPAVSRLGKLSLLTAALTIVFGIFFYFVYNNNNDLEPLKTETIESPPSLAVLPLLNLSGGKNNDYFADGLTEELINTFSQQTHLKVTARTSSFAFKGSEQSLRLIADQLTVRYLLQGSIRRYDDSVKVSVQLIDSHTLNQLVSLDFSDEMTEIISLQEKIAKQVTQGLSKVITIEPVKARSSLSNNINANDLFWLGHFQLKKRTNAGIESAIGSFRQLITEHGNKSRYLLALAEAYLIKSVYTAGEIQPLIDQAKQLITTAELEPDNQLLTQEIWGLYYLTVNELDLAISALKNVAEQSPNNARARLWLGNAFQSKGELNVARRWLDEGRKLDPLNPTLNRFYARNLLRSGDYKNGTEILQQASDNDDSSAQLELELSRWAFNYQKNDGLKWALKANKKEPDQIESRIALAFSYLQQGDMKNAERFLTEAQNFAPNKAITFLSTVNFYLYSNHRNKLISFVNNQIDQNLNQQDTDRNMSPSYMDLWRGISHYYQNDHQQALQFFSDVINTKNKNPIEQVEAMVFSGLVYNQLEDNLAQQKMTTLALEKIKQLKEKGWGIPYLSACQYVVYFLQADQVGQKDILRNWPDLLKDFSGFLSMHDVK